MSFISPIPTDTNGNERTTGSLQSLGKDDFLQLMVAKLQNQDPLEPMSDENYIAQLAQFSSLEQMNNIADGISASNNLDLLQMQSLNNVMASGLIGKEVKAEYDGFYIEEGVASTINYTTKNYADEVTFVIKDLSGNVVNTLTQKNIQSGANSFEWDGTDRQGNLVSDGYYTVDVTAQNSDGTKFTPSLSMVGKVESVIYRSGSAFVKVNGGEIPLGDITAVADIGVFTGEDEG